MQVPNLTGHHSRPVLQEGQGWPLLRCVVAFQLHIGEQPVASLSLYAQGPGVFGAQVLELAGAFAEHAALAFNAAAMAEKIIDMQDPLEHARDLGAAVGIIMQRRRLTQSGVRAVADRQPTPQRESLRLGGRHGAHRRSAGMRHPQRGVAAAGCGHHTRQVEGPFEGTFHPGPGG